MLACLLHWATPFFMQIFKKVNQLEEKTIAFLVQTLLATPPQAHSTFSTSVI